MHDRVDLSTLIGELDVLEAETFEVLDYNGSEGDMSALASTSTSTSCCSSSG